MTKALGYAIALLNLRLIHLICLDARTLNVYILAGYDEELEFQILPNGELSDESN